MEQREEPVARGGHFGAIDLDKVKRHVDLADETIAAATRQLELQQASPEVDEPDTLLSEAASQRLTSVNARAKLAALDGRRTS
jgi:hypothetical protein